MSSGSQKTVGAVTGAVKKIRQALGAGKSPPHELTVTHTSLRGGGENLQASVVPSS
jgi:hypothetical protein